MKRIITFVVSVVLLLSMTSCTREYLLNEEAAWYGTTTYPIASLSDISYDMAREVYFDYYPTDNTVIYFPVSGEYQTLLGEKFTAVVADSCDIRFHENMYYSRICYDITVYDEDGNLIFEKNDFCSYVHVAGKSIDLTYVSEDFRLYWLAMTVRSDEVK